MSQGLQDSTSPRENDDTTEAERPSRKLSRRQWGFLTAGAWATTIAASILYLGIILHYAINVPFGDEWTSVLPLVHTAVHHHLTANQLWRQDFNESHLLLPNILFALDGQLGHFDVRILIFISCLLQIASLLILQKLAAAMSGRTLPALPAAAIAISWLSFADAGNTLWGYQVQLFLTVFFFLVCLLVLHVQSDARWSRLAFAGAILAAAAASVSCIQGLLVWPIGLGVLLWQVPSVKMQWKRALAWCVAGGAMVGVYLIGYNSSESDTACFSGPKACSTAYGLHHLGKATLFGLTLLGNIFPVSDRSLLEARGFSIGDHQLLGIVVLVSAAFVCVRSFSRRRAPLSWLPVTLIAFGLLWDASIAIGRVGEGPTTALQSHFATSQLLLITGITIGLLSEVFSFLNKRTFSVRSATPRFWVTVGGVCAVVGIAFIASMTAGLNEARQLSFQNTDTARVIVNLDRMKQQQQGCYISFFVYDGLLTPSQAKVRIGPSLQILQDDHLSTFNGGTYAQYRKLGPPVLQRCSGES